MEVERKEDVLRALGELTASVRRSLGESGASLARNNVPIEEATTPSLDALKAYTEAVNRRAAGAEIEAVELLERAIAIDPQFALAHTTLSSVYGGFGETGRSEEYARLAYDLRDRVSERERLYITYQFHDRVTGDQLRTREALEVWKRTYPRDYRPANALALLLIRLGDYAAAAVEAEEAVKRNPLHAFPRSNLAHALRGSGRYAEARRVAEEAMRQGLETVPMRRLLYQLAVLQDDDALAEAQVAWAADHPRNFDISGARGTGRDLRGTDGGGAGAVRQNDGGGDRAGIPAGRVRLRRAGGVRRSGLRLRLRAARPGADGGEDRDRLRAAAARGGRARARRRTGRSGRARPAAARDPLAGHAAAERLRAGRRGRRAPRAGPSRRGDRRAPPRLPYEHGIVAALLPIYMRAEARLRAGAHEEAAREFQAILTHRGADPFSPVVPLAYLGLGRAHAGMAARTEARAAYEMLFEIWANADPDLPALRTAREEMQALGSGL